MEREKNMQLYLPEIPWGSLLGLGVAEDALTSLWGTYDLNTPTHWERNRGLLNYFLRQMPSIILLDSSKHTEAESCLVSLSPS